MDVFSGITRNVAELAQMPDEYRVAVTKIVVSHAVNEIAGAEAYDEPAIRLAPTPYHKWLACRSAMEEYGHHVHFSRLARQLGVPEAALDHKKKHLSVMEFPMSSWVQFVVIKAIGDLAEVVMVEELEHCSFLPLRDLAVKTMPEEKFHAGFGRDQMKELVETGVGREEVQRAVDDIFPVMLPFFGSSNSPNNLLFRKWGVKWRTNDDMRADYVQRVKNLLEGDFGLRIPRARG